MKMMDALDATKAVMTGERQDTASDEKRALPRGLKVHDEIMAAEDIMSGPQDINSFLKRGNDGI